MTYETIEWITTNLQILATKGGCNCELGHSQVKLTSSRTFLTVKSGRGACRFQWRVGPSYCEYSGVTYNLLVSNIGGTNDLAHQLPSNREFGVNSVPNPSRVQCKPAQYNRRSAGWPRHLVTDDCPHKGSVMREAFPCRDLSGHATQ